MCWLFVSSEAGRFIRDACLFLARLDVLFVGGVFCFLCLASLRKGDGVCFEERQSGLFTRLPGR